MVGWRRIERRRETAWRRGASARDRPLVGVLALAEDPLEHVPKAQVQLAIRYRDGIIVERHLVEAHAWYDDAAGQGIKNAESFERPS